MLFLPFPALAASIPGIVLMTPIPASANEATEMVPTFCAAVDRVDRNACAAMVADGFEENDRPAAAPAVASDAQVILTRFPELATSFAGAVHTLDPVEPMSPDMDGNPRAMVGRTFNRLLKNSPLDAVFGT